MVNTLKADGLERENLLEVTIQKLEAEGFGKMMLIEYELRQKSKD